MKALVLGGYGAVGALVVRFLREYGHTAIAAGRDPARADVRVDLRERGLRSYREAVARADVVVNAAGTEDPELIAAATGQGAAFVDATATASYIDAVERLDPKAPVLLSVGLAPGLTNLLAADLAASAPRPDPIDLAVLLGAGEAHGKAAEEWSFGLIGADFPDPVSGAPVRNFTAPRAFRLPGLGRRRLYRADFSDQHTLSRDLGVPVRTWFGLDSRAATRALAALTRLPAALRPRVPAGLHLPGSDAWTVFARSAHGSVSASGRGQSRGTAGMAALAAEVAVDLEPGVHHLHRALSLADAAGLPCVEVERAVLDVGGRH
ncbi:NAD-dependent epimerase/dehydratase family protein [Nocardiopsis suaedae]|uniref:Saccharopine dehydrogenase n=1 Tax=Nocardiopsis suaedae TaxID=3018444 RepID=A0ABT4TLV5_9ACTN|nr:NAD-dependent epimerase/dehydratase family protein [Nocardiopsis suaedae]MDA2805679.1 saccharopine dehydrogenase [Nocardiopsis suaedae]